MKVLLLWWKIIIRGISGVKEFTSSSREGFATITVTALNGYDMDELLSDVKNVVDGISNFPAGAEKPIVSKKRSMDMGMFFSLTSETDNILELNNMANRIEDDLLATGKISQISIFGVPSNLELAIELDETQMRRYNLTFTDIQNAISLNNIDISGGTIRSPREQIKVLSRQRSVDPEDVKQIVLVANTDGQIVKIGDIASVTLQVPEDPTNGYSDKKTQCNFHDSKVDDGRSSGQFSEEFKMLNIIKFNETHDDYKLDVKNGLS